MSYRVALDVVSAQALRWTIEEEIKDDAVSAESYRRQTAFWCERADNALPPGYVYRLPLPKRL